MIEANKLSKGSVTLEAAIAIPIFISVILSVSLFIKIIFTHEIIQNAISRTANELSTYSYLYHLSGIESIHNEIQQKIEKINENADNNENSDNMPDFSIEIPDELKYIFYSIIKGAYDDSINQLCIPVTKLCLKKNLVTDEIKDPDERLKMLDVVDGFEGLDFSMSGFFEDDNDNINIVVRYKIDLPTPVRIFPPFTIIQRASVRGWLGGDEQNNESREDEKQEDIWSLDNFTRGRKIRKLFGANLPFTFPVLASFNYGSGTATMIKSMDLTSASYQNIERVSKKIKFHIEELEAYNGQEKPWGQDKIIIKNNNIIKRQLILVIPNNPITSVVELEIEQCKLYAQSKGINLKIQKYGHKKAIEKDEDIY